jgi:hypothetical protein
MGGVSNCCCDKHTHRIKSGRTKLPQVVAMKKMTKNKGATKFLLVAIVKKTTKEKGRVSFPSIIVATNIHRKKLGATLLPSWLM